MLSVRMTFLEFDIGRDKLNYQIRYDRRYINEELLTNFINSYKKLYLDVLDDLASGQDNKPVINYDILDNMQYHKIVCEFNSAFKNYSKNKAQLFEKQAARQ